MTRVANIFSVVSDGSSRWKGRLCGDLDASIDAALPTFPEAVGPISHINLGKGGSTSADILARAPLVAALRPKFILCEPCAINACIDTGSGPAVSRAQHIQNTKDAVAIWRDANPDVDITLMTSATISAAITGFRPHYADYVADEIALASVLGVRLVDVYGSMPNPLDQHMTFGAGPPNYTPWNAFTFDPAAKNAHVALSGGNLVATSTTANCAVRATVSHNSGKRYVGFRVDDPTGVAIGLGGAGAGMADGEYVGANIRSVGLNASGQLFAAGVLQATYDPIAAGDEVGVCWDASAGKIFFYHDGNCLNGDMLQGTGGFAVTANAANFPMVSLSPGGQVTALPGVGAPGDGLHLLKAAATQYMLPPIAAWFRARMAEHFGL